MGRTLKFTTFGCKVNQYETQYLREQILAAGLTETAGPHADFYVINSCAVTAESAARSRNLIRRCLKISPQSKVILTGCLADYETEQIRAISPRIIVLTNSEKPNIQQMLCRVPGAGIKIRPGISYFKDHTRAFMKIQDGCDNFCAYCVVPYLRGKPRSRQLKEIIEEAWRLAANGYREIVLSGVNLGVWGQDLPKRMQLSDALEGLAAVKGITRLRLSSIEPQYVTRDLVQLMASRDTLCPHLHMPLQSGDDRVLKKMRRQYTAAEYQALCVMAKEAINDLAITTDVIVGFPGETEAAFNNTVDLCEKVGFLRVHVFSYSPRRLTAAYPLKPVAGQKTKKRHQRLQQLSDKLSLRFRKRYLGKYLSVLAQTQYDGFWRGYTPNYIEVLIKREDNIRNQEISVKIAQVRPKNTFGR